MGNMAIG